MSIRSIVVATTLSLFALAAHAAQSPASAQSPVASGSANGTVASDRGPVGGATVSISGPASKTTKTAADGTFAFGSLPDGTYQLTIKRTGFNTLTDTPFTITRSSTATIRATLGQASLESLQTIGSASVNNRPTLSVNTTPAAQATVTNQDYVDRGNFQVTNLLEELPGVEVNRKSSGGGPGANVQVSVRGADPYETQVLVDGHPVSGGSQGDYLIQFLNPLLLSDIEVDKGPGAFGNTIASQVGGRVNFRTPTISATPTGVFTAGYDSFNGSTVAARFSDTFGKFGVLVGYARFGTPGYNTQPVYLANADGPVGTGLVPNATLNQLLPATQLYDNKSELVKLAYNFSPATTLTLGYLGSQSYVDYTGNLTTLEPVNVVAGPCAACGTYNSMNGGGNTTGNPSYTTPGGLHNVGSTIFASTTEDNLYLGNYETNNEPLFTADLRTQVGPGSLLGRFYAASISRIIDDPQQTQEISQCDTPTCYYADEAALGNTYSPFNQQQLDILHGADFEYDIPAGNDIFTLGFDTHADTASSCSGADPTFPASECSIQGVKTVSTTASLRTHLALGSKASVDLGNYFSNSTFVGSRYDPRIAFELRPNASSAIRLSFGSSYVAPYAQIAKPTFVNRKTLNIDDAGKPETSVSYDLGGDFLVARDTKVSIDAYNTLIYNRFATNQQNGVNGTYQGTPFTSVLQQINQANTRTAGIELGFIHAPRVGIGANVSADFMRSYAYNSNFDLYNAGVGNYGNIADGAQTVGDPYTHGRAELNYRFARGVRLAFGTSYYGANNSFNEGGFTLFDANAQLPVSGGFTLNVSGLNLFDHDGGRTFGEYAYGFAPVQAPGGNTFNPQTLFFAPPRQVTVQLSHPIGGR